MNFTLTNQRLFTFGCSFTQYIWPTWADILGKNFQYYENWGLSGAGNLYIFNSIIEANKRHTFNNDDSIIIMWSGITRNDYYNNNSWQPIGGDFLFKQNDIDGYEVINYAYIDAIKLLFDSLKLNYKMLSLSKLSKTGKAYNLYKQSIDSITPFPYKQHNKTVKLDLSDLKNTYFYNHISSAYERHAGSDWPKFEDYWNNPTIVKNNIIRQEIDKCIGEFTQGYHHLSKTINLWDDHPSPGEHLSAVRKLFPTFELSQNIEEWIQNFDNSIKNGGFKPYCTNLPKERL